MPKVKEQLLSGIVPMGRKAPRVIVRRTHAVDIALAQGADDVLLPVLTPMAYNADTGVYDVAREGVSAEYTLTVPGTAASAGTLDVTIKDENGIEHTAEVDFDASIQVLKAALDGLAPIKNIAGDSVTVTESNENGGLADANNVITVVLPAGKEFVLSIDDGGLTGNAPVLVEVQAGESAGGLDIISGFIWPDDIVQYGQSSDIGASGDSSTAVLLIKGDINFADIPLPNGMTSDTLAKLIRRSELRKKEIYITELRGAQA